MGEARDLESLVRVVTDLVVARVDGGGRAQAAGRTDEASRRATGEARGSVLVLLPVPPTGPADLARGLEELARLGWRVRGTGSAEALAAMPEKDRAWAVAWA